MKRFIALIVLMFCLCLFITGKGYCSYSVKPGETGVTDTQYPYGDVRRYGAVGNGTTDDHNAIQKAMDQYKIVVFEPGKTYLCNDGLLMNEGQIIVGNGATILIGKSFAPTRDNIYGFLRYRWRSDVSTVLRGTYRMDELTILFNSNYQRTGEEYVLFWPMGFDTVTLNNVMIKTTSGGIVPLHLMYACEGKNIWNNVSLINTNQGMSGGCMWLRNDFATEVSVKCSNSYFHNECSDETLAFYGSGGVSATFTNCKIEATNSKLLKNSLPIAIYDDSNTKYSGPDRNVNVKFQNCELHHFYDPGNTIHKNVCFIGVGSSNYNKRAAVSFEGCNIINDAPVAVFELRSNPATLANMPSPYNSLVKLYNCKVESVSPLLGNYTVWQLDNDKPTSIAPSIEIKGSLIDCTYALFDIPNTQVSSVKAVIENCRINITRAVAVVKQCFPSPLLCTFNSNILTTDVTVNFYSQVSTKVQSTFPVDAAISLQAYDNILNNGPMTNISQYTPVK